MNSFLSAFLSRTLLDRAGGHRRLVLEAWAQKERESRLQLAEIDRIRRERLVRLLCHARDAVPFYRELLAGRCIDEGSAMDVLGGLPLVRRAEIQRAPEQFLAASNGDRLADATGGSTGTPLTFYVDRATQIARESSLMWADGMAGWRYGDRIAMLWGSDRDVQSALAQWRARLRWVVENRRWFNTFDTSEAGMDRWHEELTRFAPHVIVAYAGSLFLFARHLKQRGWRPRYPLRALVSSAEVITPSMRAEVASVFGKPVFDRYGNREFGAIAAECNAHEGLHLNASDCIVEMEGGEGAGNLIVTYLHNRVMPFIRYDTGDVAGWLTDAACRCGRTTPRLTPVSGRRGDTIRTRAGKLIHGEYFTHLLYGAEGVKNFQFIQEQVDDYCLRVEADPQTVRAAEACWLQELKKVLGDTARIRIEPVEKLPILPSGKHKFTISLVHPAE